MSKITLSHGSGGRLSHDLIQNLFLYYFNGTDFDVQTDSAILSVGSENLAFTTDSYIIDPVFFPGGDIGKLAVCGTVNDLAVSGAVPLHLSVGFIIEEGFEMKFLERIVKSMAEEAASAGVSIVTGDTKIINKGKADKIFINTSGIGKLEDGNKHISYGSEIKTGDKLIVSGDLGRHEIAVMTARENLGLKTPVESDCACLHQLTRKLVEQFKQIHFMRDITRGGLATVLNEMVEKRNFGIQLDEQRIPADDQVKSIGELLGLDPLYMANEGRIVIVAGADEAEKIVKTMQADPQGRNAAIIGEITDLNAGQVIMETEIGGKRIIDMLAGMQLPRIC